MKLTEEQIIHAAVTIAAAYPAAKDALPETHIQNVINITKLAKERLMDEFHPSRQPELTNASCGTTK